jgi:hypothetical protein
MPKTPIDYAKTIIYKLVHKDDLYDENIYTGHTTEMTKRKAEHKSDCTNPNSDKYNQKKYQYIRENGGWDEWLMIEIEKYPCKDKPEAIARERVIQAEMKAKLNTNVPGRTKKEWRIDNHEKLLKQKKQYYQDNRESILERVSNYVQDNRDKVLENKKQHYQDNRENLAEKAKQKITCDHCGSIVRKYEIQRHKRTQKCINFKPA